MFINNYTTLGGRVTCTQCNALSKRTLGKGVKRQRSEARLSVDSTGVLKAAVAQ